MVAEVSIEPAVHAALLRAHRGTGAREFCGVLGGARRAARCHVARCEPVANVAARDDRFAIEPSAFVAAERRLARDGLVWLGFVHGHPGGPAVPSAVDTEQLWRDCLQFLVGGGEPAEVRAWRWHDRRWAELPLRIGAELP